MMEQQRIEVFLEKYRQQPPKYLVELEREALAAGVPIIRRGTRDMLRYLLKTAQPARVLEVGAAVGYSALYMKECLPDTSQITTIEKVEMRLVEARRNLASYDKRGQIALLEGDASEHLRCLADAGRKYDFIFMDAAKGQYLNFLPDVRRMLAAGGVLVSDNIFHEGDVLESRYAVTRRDRTIHGRMREYLQTLMEIEEWETICLPIGDGMTISYRK